MLSTTSPWLLILKVGTSVLGFLIILRLGVVDRYLNFKLDDQTSVYKSCTATMNGDTYVFGGHFDDGEKSNTKQVSHPKSANRR